MTSVRSGHGIGKSAVESWAVIWFLSTRPFPKIPCTAPTQHQLWDILWAEVAKWLRSNPVLSDSLIWTREKVYMRGWMKLSGKALGNSPATRTRNTSLSSPNISTTVCHQAVCPGP